MVHFQRSQVAVLEAPFLPHVLLVMPGKGGGGHSKQLVIGLLSEITKFLLSQGVEKEKLLTLAAIKD